ncbi:hypothetical protein ABZ858_32180 [Streptomyces sp. NPDC047017]|uniref:hypothetical protein n=1 Tax=Streptomyces sp. NPDC047017 TaxID=3155024 RepID=UPI0033F38B59
MFDEDSEYCDECCNYGCSGHETCTKCDGEICPECDGCDCPDSPCLGYYNHY